MAFADQQLQAAYDFQAFIDTNSGGPGQGWFRIVTSPEDARRQIGEGKLAVVLGLEVDKLFNCRFPLNGCTRSGPGDGVLWDCSALDQLTDHSQCKDPNPPSDPNADPLTSEEWVQKQLDFYYDHWGVRAIIPIHNYDNSFGGTATWRDALEVANRVIEGHWYASKECPPEPPTDANGRRYGFKLGGELGPFMQWLMTLFLGEGSAPPPHPENASCNTLGLTKLGRGLIQAMMDKGMIIDVDHMSVQSINDTIEEVKSYGGPAGYPLMASHGLFFDVYQEEQRHERMRTASQLEEISAMGGMVGVMLKDDHLDGDLSGQRRTLPVPGTASNDCRHSSTAFAQAYTYALGQMAPDPARPDILVPRVGMGSNFNGMGGHYGPRFGSRACGGDPTERSKQLLASQPLDYPFSLREFGQFRRQVSGQRTFDYNVDGLAHVGLLPDMVADLENVGVSSTDLDPLMRSAESFVRMWDQAMGNDAAPQGCDCRLIDSTPPDALCKSATVVLNAAGDGTLAAADVDNGSSDSCSDVDLTPQSINLSCATGLGQSVTGSRLKTRAATRPHVARR